MSGYEILELIGAGGMGVVYRAQQHRPHRLVALKLVAAGLLSPPLLRRFEYEAEVLGRLQHEGIAQIYEAGVDADSGRPFFAMELVEGRRLDEYVRGTNPDLPARLRLLIRICQAVHYAHTKGVVHRDLKPANILVTADGHPKILDFGVARLTDADVQAGEGVTTLHTQTGAILGTLAYMAPEQASGAHADVDTRSDVYALGVIAYELLSGRLPLAVAGKPLPAAVRAIVEEEPSRLSSADRNLRGDLETIVGKALAKEKTQRYDSAAALAEDVRRYLEYEPITARRPSTWYNLRKFARRNKAVVAGVAASFLILLAGAATSTAFAIRASRQAKVAEARRVEAVDASRREAEQRLEADRKRVEAENANADTQAINEFLTDDLLSSVDPKVARGRDITVREVLDNAAKTVGGRFRDRPHIEMSMRQTLVNLYHALGHDDLAFPQAQRTLELTRKLFGDDHSETLTAVSDTGMLLLEMGRTAQAERYTQEALDGRLRTLGADHLDTLKSINNMAILRQEQNRLEEAETLLRQSRDGHARVVGEDHELTMFANNNLGHVLTMQGRVDEAAEIHRRTLEGRLRELGEDHPDTLASMNNLAVAVQAQGKLNEAHLLFQQALEINRRVMGEEHPQTLVLAQSLSRCLIALDRPADAEALLRPTLERQRSKLGADHFDSVWSARQLAAALAAQRKWTEAESVYREALPGLAATIGSEHFGTLQATAELATVLAALDRSGEAESLYRQALEAMRERLGTENPNTRAVAARWADFLDAHDRPDEAAAVRAEYGLPQADAASRPASAPSTAPASRPAT